MSSANGKEGVSILWQWVGKVKRLEEPPKWWKKKKRKKKRSLNKGHLRHLLSTEGNEPCKECGSLKLILQFRGVSELL